MMHACIYILARLATRTTGSPMRARRTHARTCCVRARACACASGRPRICAGTRERVPSVSTAAGWLGSQAFYSASRFNANIGAWNTAGVTSLYGVCAASSAWAARHPRRDALGGSSMRRGPSCEAGPPMQAHVCAQTWGHAHARASPCVGKDARTKDGIYVWIHIHIYTMHFTCIDIYTRHVQYIC
jgi:hypothetical protein